MALFLVSVGTCKSHVAILSILIPVLQLNVKIQGNLLRYTSSLLNNVGSLVESPISSL